MWKWVIADGPYYSILQMSSLCLGPTVSSNHPVALDSECTHFLWSLIWLCASLPPSLPPSLSFVRADCSSFKWLQPSSVESQNANEKEREREREREREKEGEREPMIIWEMISASARRAVSWIVFVPSFECSCLFGSLHNQLMSCVDGDTVRCSVG